MFTHVLVHGEHDQFNDAHEHELHIGRLTEKSTHGYQRCGNCNIRAEQTENHHVSRSIMFIDTCLSLLTGITSLLTRKLEISIRNTNSRFQVAI